MDEKKAAKVLESNMNKKLAGTFAFTVVSNPFIGLECTEHTDYDAIFISFFATADLSAFDFLKLLRNVGCTVPIILVHLATETIPSNWNSNDENGSYSFSSFLRKPYNLDEMASALKAALCKELPPISNPPSVSSNFGSDMLQAAQPSLLTPGFLLDDSVTDFDATSTIRRFMGDSSQSPQRAMHLTHCKDYSI